jgi:hypothetical protein
MQKWEYMFLVRSRGFSTDKDHPKAPWQVGSNWNVDMDKKLAELGDQGWELVTVSPRSSYLGGREVIGGGGVTLDYAGYTSEEVWVFKRPKQ